MDLDALYKLTHGLYVLGARDENRFAGSIVDAVMQVANKPVAIALSCSNGSYTKQCIEKDGVFSLSVLCKNVSPFVVANFGFQSSRNVDKWKNVEYFEEEGLPFLKDNLAIFRCRVLHKFPLESNTLFVAEVQSAAAAHRPDEPFIKTQKGKEMSDTEGKKWVCTVCGYVYDGEVPFEDLPEDWVCPLCGVGKELFELQEV